MTTKTTFKNIYLEIKQKHSDNVNKIMEEQKVFWAFSQEQLEKGKEQIGITDNNLLTSIGMGGFMPKANAKEFSKLIELEDARYKKELKEAKDAKDKAIIYELNNHECFYAGDLQPVIELFDGVYSKDEIMAVYKKQLPKERQFINKENDTASLTND